MFSLFLTSYCILILFDNCSAGFLGNEEKGEFSVSFRQFGSCNKSWSGSNEMQFNVRLNRKTKEDVLLSGNFTNSVPMDDSISLDVQLWRFHHERGFQKIPFSIKMNRICSSMELYLGKIWKDFFRGEVVKCPLPRGVHTINDVNVNALAKNKLLYSPPQFLYGRYKVVFSYRRTQNNKVLGCACVVLDFNKKI